MATARKSAATGGTAPHFHRGKYAPDSFMIPGQDQNGNSIRLWCRVVPMLDRAIDVIFASRKFPFKSKGDLMRWCIKRGVDQLEEMEPISGSVMAQVEAMMAILRDEEQNHSFLTLFNTMTGTIGMHVQAQAMGEARRVLALMKSHILKMEDGYWRQRYLKELDTKFGHLMGGSNVGMGDFIDHPDSSGEVDDGD